MDPSRFNGTTMASSKETEALRTTEQGHVGATSDHDSQANPLAPLLQFGQYNPGVPSMEPPPYSSVVTQDSQAWLNHPGTSSTVNGQAPYPTGPAPYPTNGAPTFEALSEAPYPKAPAGVAPESVVSPRYSPPTNQGTIYPTLSGAGDQYYPVQNQYQQNQVPPPQTVYVVQNNADTAVEIWKKLGVRCKPVTITLICFAIFLYAMFLVISHLGFIIYFKCRYNIYVSGGSSYKTSW